ncbi:Copia protein [Eumeta japonica]|uniref:Copia protein n=1 Tax=Eumeta variegata TaxID=151549 RepID=A0A4C1Z8N0_EUMVA|nr:Copia protein [Eumeta japonica]
MKLVYKKNVDGKISGYCDSDWANDIEDRKSCTGYIFLFQGATIIWNSKEQQIIALSTSEAEYMALASAIQEALWLKQLADEFQSELKGTPIGLYCDNQSAISLSDNAAYHARSKHIDVRYHFVREKIAAKQIMVQYKCTGD